MSLNGDTSNQPDEAGGSVSQGHVSDLSDEDILIKYCLDNKVKKAVIDELLTRGYDSLEAFKLVDMAVLNSAKIPIGQRRLIMQIAKNLVPPEYQYHQGIWRRVPTNPYHQRLRTRRLTRGVGPSNCLL